VATLLLLSAVVVTLPVDTLKKLANTA